MPVTTVGTNTTVSTNANGEKIFGGILNEYVRKPKNLNEYTAFRGVTDWTQLGQFDQFETGYSFLSVISMPPFMERLAQIDPDVNRMVESFHHMMEYEFRGLDGLPDISTDVSTISNGAQDITMINNVTSDGSIEVSMTYYERAGGLITRFSEYYITGIKDYRSKAKTYHGLIARGDMEPGYENEVFTLMYMVTDNTYLKLERAYLLANAQINKVELGNMYNSQRGEISNREISITFTCHPVWGKFVDQQAETMLQVITGAMDKKVTNDVTGETRPVAPGNGANIDQMNGANKTAVLDSANYNFDALKNIPNAVASEKALRGMS